ncbi:chemotaxis-specific protein-glutamate methyltransferase CheB [Erythrobacteraceae bacterium CFH 75059]|nr:chemotaxis-specific protein-glutamate methyltransferase CheB [Erythrobacteraceae bacterium CFH 75059]
MIVDDSLTARTVFARMIEADPALLLVAQASTAEEALGRLSTCSPDVVLLDLEMPGMGGLEALPQFLALRPSLQVLVVSSLTEAGAWHSVRALAAGAADTMLKPVPGSFGGNYREQFTARIRALGRRDAASTGRDTCPQTQGWPPSRAPRPGKRPRVVAIGASTGGVHAINAVLGGLPAEFALPILITQHLPASFVPVFARQLELVSRRRTIVGEDGQRPAPGEIILAPGHAHLTVERRGEQIAVALCSAPSPSGCRPAVDPMLSSIAEAFDGEAAALILSGMGRDGVLGAGDLVRAGGTVIAQEPLSCAVWGMPKAVAQAGLAAAELRPADMGPWLSLRTGSAEWR